MDSVFFAMLSRMKYISRWALMRNTERESLSEHSMETAVLAHALAVIAQERFGVQCQPERAAVMALFHDATEILTGDMPTPVKYYSPQLRAEYGKAEQAAGERLLSMLPQDMQKYYEDMLIPDSEQYEHKLVKAADKLSALIKCIEERKAGNMEFASAQKSTEKALHEMNMPEVEAFMEQFLPAYSLTLDEQGQM